MTRTTEEIRGVVEEFGYKLLGEYQEEKSGIRRVVIQDSHGYKYDVNFRNLMRGHIPKFVDIHNLFSLPNISLWLEIKNKPFVLCKNNVYKGSQEKLFFQCLMEECQEIFDVRWNDIYSGQECPFCGGDRVGKHNNLVYLRPELVREWNYDKNEYNPEDYTEFAREKVSWVCSECGSHWDAWIYHRSRGSGCPNCADLQTESTIANELKEYFKENHNSISEYPILRNPKTGYWLPYDVYIPYGENPELNGFYIEVHWEHHYKTCLWHKKQAKRNNTTPEEELGYQQWKDKLKKKFAKKNGTYIEIDLRKIKTTEEAIEYIENIMRKTLS